MLIKAEQLLCPISRRKSALWATIPRYSVMMMTMLMAWMFNIVVVDQLIRDSTIVTRSFAGPVEGSCAGLHTTQCLNPGMDSRHHNIKGAKT